MKKIVKTIIGLILIGLTILLMDSFASLQGLEKNDCSCFMYSSHLEKPLMIRMPCKNTISSFKKGAEAQAK